MDGGQISGVAALGRVLSVSGSQAQVRLAVGSSDEREAHLRQIGRAHV